jgi:hypothetical protein
MCDPCCYGCHAGGRAFHAVAGEAPRDRHEGLTMSQRNIIYIIIGAIILILVIAYFLGFLAF